MVVRQIMLHLDLVDLVDQVVVVILNQVVPRQIILDQHNKVTLVEVPVAVVLERLVGELLIQDNMVVDMV
tara:strand:+ start:79 stop:288 length:210 start_codon:yes stop_codon:yes gene_type:complete